MKMLVISFDALNDTEFEKMAANAGEFPHSALFMKQSAYVGGVKTVFVSNTYPAHCSVVTGVVPAEHGVISNFVYDLPNGEHVWAQQASGIKAKTLWEAAREKGLKTAAVLWPVTCGAKIDVNIPEVHLLEGQNRIVENLKNGSFFAQINALLRHGKKLNGEKQPFLDDFVTSVSVDVLRSKKPDLTLVHLTAYDDFCHREGRGGAGTQMARKSLDANLGRLLGAIDDDTCVLAFSDHGQLDITDTINLSDEVNGGFDQCGGSAFYTGENADNVKAEVTKFTWFGRFLTDAEMKESGYAGKAAFGMAAKAGACFSSRGEYHGTGGWQYRGNHGYPTDYPDFATFYATRGGGLAPSVRRGGNITDITGIVKNVLNI